MRHDIVTEFFSFMTFCPYQDFVIDDCFDRHKNLGCGLQKFVSHQM